jgi:hypothetical protein
VAESIQTPAAPPLRGTPDRRRRPTRMLSRYTLVGRRHRNRRTTDPQASYYVDFPRGSILLVVILLLLMILADTVSTLHIVNRGGGEANPIMRRMLDLSPFWFAFVKVANALAAFILLGVHCKFRLMRRLTTVHLTTVLLLIYVALACYHVVLLVKIHG